MNPRNLVESKFNPRNAVDKAGDDYKALRESVRVNGVLNPLIVCEAEEEGTYEVLCGKRRWTVALELDLQSVPVTVKECKTDKGKLMIALAEQLNRADLSEGEVIDGVSMLHEMGVTPKQMQIDFGVSADWVSERLNIAQFPVVKEKLDAGKIRHRDARQLARSMKARPDVVEEVNESLGKEEDVEVLIQRVELKKRKAEKEEKEKRDQADREAAEKRKVEEWESEGFKVLSVPLSQDYLIDCGIPVGEFVLVDDYIRGGDLYDHEVFKPEYTTWRKAIKKAGQWGPIAQGNEKNPDEPNLLVLENGLGNKLAVVRRSVAVDAINLFYPDPNGKKLAEGEMHKGRKIVRVKPTSESAAAEASDRLRRLKEFEFEKEEIRKLWKRLEDLEELELIEVALEMIEESDRRRVDQFFDLMGWERPRARIECSSGREWAERSEAEKAKERKVPEVFRVFDFLALFMVSVDFNGDFRLESIIEEVEGRKKSGASDEVSEVEYPI